MSISREKSIMLKGIAILLILVQHFGQAFSISLVNPLGSVGVFLFLFLSGYGLAISFDNSGRKQFFKKKYLKSIFLIF